MLKLHWFAIDYLVGPQKRSDSQNMAKFMNTHNLLIIDDHPTSKKLASLLLERIGLPSTAVENCEQLNNALQEHKFSMILLGLRIPYDMEALRCLNCILKFRKQQRQVLPVVAVTAYAAPQDRDLCLKLGADDYLSKPYTSKQFWDMIAKWIFEQKSELKLRDVG
jgi:CheY-like chemotaxis protein